jgi:hypothetical protein
VSTAEKIARPESERYFMVGPEQKVITINRALFEAIARYTKPNSKLAKVEVTFKNGGVCGITCTEHLI